MKCEMYDKDCDMPFIDGISIDGQFNISAVTDYIKGWSDPVCIMCQNKDEKVGIELVIHQKPCTTNCPDDGGTGGEEGTGECKGFLNHVSKPKNITFGFTESLKAQYTNITAMDYFVNKNSTKCPITKCTMMDSDCDEPFLNGIMVD